ncbi:MBL fold metallo-hydrolase RNA specificity domain-containing protein [Marinobacter sp. X15-166B]|uniref:MBL fold metallo-hydrolase RNA specificity domain-containing protein n=1 Tax=Marinobacter sp. X15-166B TaxID=1897620 RepID=UPI00085C8A8D|nr:MBL fold metallo-hydrolase [Marinobacter sp. X15-166B]OEY67607.1 mRNA 3'-end processing factor [Marinobacter sp. X15-166B]
MNIVFLGGAETVTGSKFLVETDTTRVLVDCGLFQGYKWLRRRNRDPLPVDIGSLDAVILTHAHLDHSGYLPVLYKRGYRGPVFAHPATVELCGIMLADSGHIQEEEARFCQRHKIGRHEKPEPLYNQDEANASLTLFQSLGYEQPMTIGDIRFHLQPVGHILGAGSVILEAEGKRVGFSGDVGRLDDIFMHAPKPLPALDLLLLESTYGNRLHRAEDPFAELAEVINSTVEGGGRVLIPSFAVGRAQVLQYMLDRLMREQRIPKLPVYLDSPMAIDVSEIYWNYPEQHKLSQQECRSLGQSTIYTRSVDASKELLGQTYPHIIIAGSGMATGGRILHHFKKLLSDHKTTVIFAGYQAGGTRGAKMVAGAETVKIHGAWIPVKARIEMLDGLSAHADYGELEQWLQQSDLAAGTAIQLVHGEPEASETFRDYLRQHTSYEVDVAGYRTILRL